MSKTTAATLPTAPTFSSEILRFRMSERQIHWAVAIPFMVCYVTATVLMAIYNPHPERPWRLVFSWTHRISGLALCVLPLWVIVRHWYDVAIHLANIREVWRWTLADLKWLLLTGPATFSKSVILPEQGKFNAGEKLNFMVLTVTVPLYLCTGLMIWSHQFAFPAWVLHLTMAALATPVLFGHLFMALVNPGTRKGLNGMITGSVDRHWASHHYGRWYRENFTDPAAAADSDVETASPTGSATGAAHPEVASGPPPARSHKASAERAEPSASTG